MNTSSHLNRRPELLILCAVAGIIGSIAPIALNVVASIIAQHDIVADTISDLGRGPHKWIMDTGFYIGAAGLLCLAIAAAHVHLGKLGWSIGIFALAMTSLVTVLLGVWDQFGGGGDLSVHTRLTFALGPLYLIGPIVMAKGVQRLSPSAAFMFFASAACWGVFATWFKLAPDSMDGVIEKIAVFTTLFWTVPLSVVFFSLGKQETSDGST